MHGIRHALGLLFMLLCCIVSTYGQRPDGVMTRLNEVKNVYTPDAFAPFNVTVQNIDDDPAFEEVLREGYLLTTKASVKNEILVSRPAYVELDIPISEDRSYTLELYRADVASGDFYINTSSGQTYALNDVNAIFYRGIVKGDHESLVSISIFENEIRGFISTSDGDRILGKTETDDRHILYFDEDLIPEDPFNCDSWEAPNNEIQDNDNHGGSGLNRSAGDCVKIYLEVENEIVTDKGGVSGAATYVFGLMNEVFTLYENENVTLAIEELFLWTTDDPFSGSSGNRLSQFVDHLDENGYNGDIAHLLGYGGGGGVAYLDILCFSQPKYRSGYSGITDSYDEVPTYSWTIEVVTHELGHNLGSPHTHACSWNGNGTAIDGCGPEAGYSEGCDAPLPPAGTIMSYCHLVGGVGIDFNMGMGTQPGNRIRNAINNANCLSTCFCADLVVTSLDSISRDTNNNTLYLSTTIKNIGDTATESGSVEVTFYAADDASGTNQILIGSTSVSNNLPPNDSIQLDATFPEPNDFMTKTYIIVVADDADDEVECTEYNNSASYINSLLPGGCTDPGAHNYNPDALVDDGSCETCFDGIQNGDETNVDCGGSRCQPCGCTIAEWEIGAPTYPQSNIPTYQSADIYASTVQWGSDADFWILEGGGNPGDAIGLDGVNSNDYNPGDWLSFELAPNFPGRLDLIQMSFDITRESNGPTNWEIRSSHNSFTTVIEGGSIIENWMTHSVNLSSLPLQTSYINIRLYMYGAQNPSKKGWVDNFSICGDYITCADGIQNGDEEGVDCGGNYCSACPQPTCPDLVIDYLDPIRLDMVDSIHMGLQISNYGDADYDGEMNVIFYMSADNTLDVGTDINIGSVTLDPGTLEIDESIYFENILLSDPDLPYIIASIDDPGESTVECEESNNALVLDYNTCTTVVSNKLNGAPGSLRWAMECAASGSTITFESALGQDTLFVRNIDPISVQGDINVFANVNDMIYLAPYPDDDMDNPHFEFNGSTQIEGLLILSTTSDVSIRGDIKPGGSMKFNESGVSQIDIRFNQ